MEGKLKRPFYLGNNVTALAKELLGKTLITNIEGKVSGGIIVETEAYSGSIDRASHAWPNKVTKRTQTIFEKGGIAYVYLCYGIHKLFNIVTNISGKPDAVLIRAIEPTIGLDYILERRRSKKVNPSISSGPGKVSSCLGIDLKHNNMLLKGPEIWLEDRGYEDFEIVETKRVGVDYAGNDALLLWRYYISDNPFVSRK